LVARVIRRWGGEEEAGERVE
jgi:hypothetical protein